MEFIRNLFDTITNNLIAGDAFYMIAKSIITTMIVTGIAWVIMFFFGTIVSYCMCYEKKIVSRLFEAICFIFRSTPALLMLLLFYYVICKQSRLDPAIIAGIALGFYGAGHLAEILAKYVRDAQRKQDASVNKRLQQVFYSVCIPQAMEDALFPIKRITIHILQWTTVVGYITVNDLTEVMNRIGQRTMYPFFSIFVCIIFYMVVTIIIEGIFRLFERRFEK